MFIQWPVNIDETFRPAYLATTGESVGVLPQINSDETYYLIGSWRVTQEQIASLKVQFPDIIVSDDFPSDWVPKQEEL